MNVYDYNEGKGLYKLVRHKICLDDAVEFSNNDATMENIETSAYATL